MNTLPPPSAPLRVVFMGCPAFAVPSLRALAADPTFSVVAAYCMPDRPKGRGQKETMTPVKEAALSLGFPVETPASFRKEPAAVERLRAFHPDFLVVVAYGLILPQDVLDIPRVGAVNLHASLLPKYRGPSPIHEALRQGDTITGNTVMLMNARMDEGDILRQAEEPIGPEDTLSALHDRLSAHGGPFLVQTLKDLAAERLTPRPQDHAQASYTTKITTGAARLDWREPATRLLGLVRAMWPCPGAWFETGGLRLKVGEASPGGPTTAEPGTILAATPGEGLLIAAGAGTTLRIAKIQRPGKSLLAAADFLRGFTFSESRLQ